MNRLKRFSSVIMRSVCLCFVSQKFYFLVRTLCLISIHAPKLFFLNKTLFFRMTWAIICLVCLFVKRVNQARHLKFCSCTWNVSAWTRLFPSLRLVNFSDAWSNLYFLAQYILNVLRSTDKNLKTTYRPLFCISCHSEGLLDSNFLRSIASTCFLVLNLIFIPSQRSSKIKTFSHFLVIQQYKPLVHVCWAPLKWFLYLILFKIFRNIDFWNGSTLVQLSDSVPQSSCLCCSLI